MFSMADCAAFPAPFHADRVERLDEAHGNARAYLARLRQRPAIDRVVREARPYFPLSLITTAAIRNPRRRGLRA